MARIAEELVEEWLNRQGFFTIRGLKLGVQEMDVLAIRPTANGMICRHLEVQASLNPVSYITGLTKELQQQTGRSPYSAKQRTTEELHASVHAWVIKKFRDRRKLKAKQTLCRATWTEELVVQAVKFPEELEAIKAEEITVHLLKDIVRELLTPKDGQFPAAGADLVNLLVQLANEGGVR